jgi:predicted amidohydrolase
MRIALYQWRSAVSDVTGNLARLTSIAHRAAEQGAQLLVCPEMSLTGYNIGADTHRLAEPADGPAAQEVARIAAEAGIAILYGYPERDGDRIYNSAALVSDSGHRLVTYRKTHLYGDLDRKWFTPGDIPVVQADVQGVRIGILICYDVEFPEMVRAHALAGTELLLVPTALMHPEGVVAEMLVPARAYENQLHLAYVNHCGQEGDLDYCGRSCLISPQGAELARAGTDEQLLVREVDPTRLSVAREQNTQLRDRRPTLYRSLCATSS